MKLIVKHYRLMAKIRANQFISAKSSLFVKETLVKMGLVESCVRINSWKTKSGYRLTPKGHELLKEYDKRIHDDRVKDKWQGKNEKSPDASHNK